MATDQEDEVSTQAMTLLQFLKQVEDWDNVNDPRARPYFEADAVRRLEDGHLAFHPHKFDAVMKAQGS